MKTRGLSLIELLIALSAGSILVIGVLSMTMSSVQRAFHSNNRLDSFLDITFLSNYFSKEIPNMGGLSIPVAGSFWLEPSCAARDGFPDCQRSDRLTLAQVEQQTTCSVTAVLGHNHYRLYKDPVTRACCLQGLNLLNRQVFLMDTNTSLYSQKTVAIQNDANCSIRTQDGPMIANDNLPVPDSPLQPYAWPTTTVVFLIQKIETFYADLAKNNLDVRVYKNGAGTIDQTKVVADRIFDFQISLGYDVDGDGYVSDTQSKSDEFMYNAVDDLLTVPPLNTVTASQLPRVLKMIGLGVIIGSPGSDPSRTSAQVLDGPVRAQAGWTLESGLSKFALRSVYIFQ